VLVYSDIIVSVVSVVVADKLESSIMEAAKVVDVPQKGNGSNSPVMRFLWRTGLLSVAW
jgi:hypothetical protein